MGGVGVASSSYQAASIVNPALTAKNAKDNGHAISFPSFGAEISYNDEHINNFQDSFDILENVLATSFDINEIETAEDQLVNDFYDLDNERINAAAGSALIITIPHPVVTTSFFTNSYYDADQLIIENVDTSSNMDAKMYALGAIVSEVGLSFAKQIYIKNTPIFVGISPKFQQVDTFDYVIDVSEGCDKVNISDYKTSHTGFNLDIGIAAQFDKFTIGLNVNNVISHHYKASMFVGNDYSYQIDPLFTAGISWIDDNYVFALDADLNKRDVFHYEGDAKQFVRVGGEYNLANWLQLRSGYRYDLQDNIENTYSLGLGVLAWQKFHIDVTGLFGTDERIGAVVSLSWTN